MIMPVDCSRKDPWQRGLDRGRWEEEVHITEHWGLSAPQTGVGKSMSQLSASPSLEPRFNLLISLINHSPSSYPLRGSEDPVSPQLRFQRLSWEKSLPVAPQ